MELLALGGDLVMLVMTFVCEPEFFLCSRATHAMLAPWEQRYTTHTVHASVFTCHIFGMMHSRTQPAVRDHRKCWYLWGRLSCRDRTVSRASWLTRKHLTPSRDCYIKDLQESDGQYIVYDNGNRTWVRQLVQRFSKSLIRVSYRDHTGVRAIYNGVRHRLDGPAVVRIDGTCEWWQDGRLHRVDGPARELGCGTREWYLHGRLHRVDGPARELEGGTREWYLQDMLHRDDGPARELECGTREWYLHGRLHRTDGPARELEGGTREWWINGEQLDLLAMKLCAMSV